MEAKMGAYKGKASTIKEAEEKTDGFKKGGSCMKKGGKEVGPASVYAPPHKGAKSYSVQQATSNMEKDGGANEVNMTVGNIARHKDKGPKTSGVKMRGTGAATKGKMSRGPMG